MEIGLGCGVASVAIVDATSAPIVAFADVPVLGDTGLCEVGGQGSRSAFPAIPGGIVSSE